MRNIAIAQDFNWRQQGCAPGLAHSSFNWRVLRISGGYFTLGMFPGVDQAAGFAANLCFQASPVACRIFPNLPE